MRSLLIALAATILLVPPLSADSSSAIEIPASPTFIVTLREQQSHVASIAVQTANAPRVDALTERKAALVEHSSDVRDPAVLAVNEAIDAALGDMRRAVLAEATRRHEASRATVESLVRELGGIVKYRSPLLNLLVVQIARDRVRDLEAHPVVASVEPDGRVEFVLNFSVPAIGASAFWSNGFTGGPFTLVVPDTGVDSSHPSLVGKVPNAGVFHQQAQNQPDYNDNPSSTDDLHGHGTHIAGNVAGQDATYRGVAYGSLGVVNAKFGYLTTIGGGAGTWSDALQAIDWAIGTAGGDVLSLSFGEPVNDSGNSGIGLFMDAVVDDLGVPVSIAAGNTGPGGGTLWRPGTSFNVVTVGAMNDRDTTSRGDDLIAGFSSRGPTGDGRIKPDIAAPGFGIMSTAFNWEGGNPDFVSSSGTSMAAPHVGASMVLILDAANGASALRTKAVLLDSSTDLGATGPDNTFGWGYLDLAAAWPQRNNVIEDTVRPNAAKFYRITGTPGESATLVWNKHVLYNGINFPNTWWPLNNLDLALYQESSGTRLDLSSSPRDNVEQVEFPAATTALAKVFVVGNLGGVANEPFALAAQSALTSVPPPALAVTLSAPPLVDTGQPFVVTADVRNPGGLGLSSSSVALNIPPGVSLLSGANPATLGSIANGGIRTASWTLSTTVAGDHPFTASATATGYEEAYSASGGPVIVAVRDVSPPVIASPTANPNPQNLGGAVNVSAMISDNLGVSGSWVEVHDPGGGVIGNFSLRLDPTSGRRFDLRPYGLLGPHEYTISATDAAGNWAVHTGSFLIADLEPPVLSSVAATPNPQEVFFAVNVTAIATDNVGVAAAYLEVTNPLGSSVNATMAFTGPIAHLERTYAIVGMHSYRVSAEDGAGLWAVATGTFEIRDMTAPVARAGPDVTVEAGATVWFDGSASSDNLGIVAYTWSLTDGLPVVYPGVAARHTFANVGTYFVTLTVQDEAGNSGTDELTVTVVDARPPEISEVRATPNPSEVGGVVTVGARVYDESGIGGVWLLVTDPVGLGVNVTMDGLGSWRYESGRPHSVRGLYMFDIWAMDVNGNFAHARGTFIVSDFTPPVVLAIADPPLPDVSSPVTVSAAVIENDVVASVVLEVRTPDGSIVSILPMRLVGTSWEASFAPGVLGTHTFLVWATDATGNLGFATTSVLAVDRVPPMVGASAPPLAEVLSTTAITASIEDNLGVFRAFMEVREPSGTVLANYSLRGASPFAVPVLLHELGPFRWSVYAVDPSGNAASTSGTTSSVDSTPPIANAGPDQTIVVGTEWSLDGSGSWDNFGIESYTWNLAALQEPIRRGSRQAVTFPTPGTYAIHLTVRDFAANAGVDTIEIIVVEPDADGDGLRNDEEGELGTNPRIPDTDGDGAWDGVDPDPLAAELNVVRLLVSWWGIFLLLVIYLTLMAAGVRRRRRSDRKADGLPTVPAEAPPPTMVDSAATPPVDSVPPPPPDLPPPPPD